MPRQRRIVFGLAALALLVGLSACQKLPTQTLGGSLLRAEKPTSLDSIPVEYGNLVSVTTGGANANEAQLWFEQADKTIVLVRMNFVAGALGDTVVYIPRR